jgi:hypothetical protein
MTQEYERVNSGHSYFNNRVIGYANIQNPVIKKYIAMCKIDTSVQARECFEQKLYVDYAGITYWPPNIEMEVHADNCYPDGTPNYVPYRYCAGILYLNDNFSGGETYFPNQLMSITPRKGKLVLFPAGNTYKHGVRKSLDNRYTIAMWLTTQTMHVEI